MTALAQDVQRSTRVVDTPLLALPVAAATAIYTGALVATNASGEAVPAADTAGLTVVGPARRGYDNSGGSAGTLGAAPARYCEVETEAIVEVAAGGTPVVGATAYAVDDNTVTADDTAVTNDIPAGTFWEPSERSGFWWVKFG